MNKSERSFLGGMVAGGLLGAVVVGGSMSYLIGEDVNRINEIVGAEETPTLSSTFKTLRTPELTYQQDFFDRDLDGETVERFRVIKYGANSDRKVVEDLERDEFSQLEGIDLAYQRFLAGDLIPELKEMVIVNRFDKNDR